MRSLLTGVALSVALSSALATQEATRPPRFVLAAGPSWDYLLTGIRLRGEYHLLRDSWLGLRLETGALWTPTQFFAIGYPYSDPQGRPGYWGFGQAMDLRLGAAATLGPFPRGPLSPYLLASVAAVQSKWSGSTYYRGFADSIRTVQGTSTRGDIAWSVGIGLRTRIAGRPFRLELRRQGSLQDLTLGTTLPF